MIVELIIGQLFLILFNVANAFIDAYKILDNKTIGHTVNFCAYFVLAIVLCLILRLPFYYTAGLFLLSAFFNRQIFFDVALNLRRGLDWYYQTKAEGPKASVLDKLERYIFGTSPTAGKHIFYFYLGGYCATVVAFIIIYG